MRRAIALTLVSLALVAGGCGLQMQVPAGFLRRTAQENGDLRAVSATGGRILVRDFVVDNDATVDYWADAVAVELEQVRGYRQLQRGEIVDGQKRSGRAIEARTVAGGVACGYFAAVFLLPRRSWAGDDRVRVLEFAAPEAEFAGAIDSVRAAVATLR